MTKKVNVLSLSFLLAITLGCGGGGGGYQGDGAGRSDSGSYGASENSQNSASDTANSNSPPAFTNLPATLEVRENQTSITTIGATDADDDVLTYSVSGVDGDLLSINASTGVLMFLDAPNFEEKSTFSVEIAVSDGTASTKQGLTINVVDIAENTSEAPLEINVVVASGSNGYGGGNKYFVNGTASPDITLEAGKTYRFLQSDNSNATHPMRLSTTENGTHGGGGAIVDGVEYVGVAGSNGAYLQYTVPSNATSQTLYYYCVNHSGMGGRLIISSSSSGGYVVTQMN